MVRGLANATATPFAEAAAAGRRRDARAGIRAPSIFPRAD
jgi:hypothetical protein